MPAKFEPDPLGKGRSVIGQVRWLTDRRIVEPGRTDPHPYDVVGSILLLYESLKTHFKPAHRTAGVDRAGSRHNIFRSTWPAHRGRDHVHLNPIGSLSGQKGGLQNLPALHLVIGIGSALHGLVGKQFDGRKLVLVRIGVPDRFLGHVVAAVEQVDEQFAHMREAYIERIDLGLRLGFDLQRRHEIRLIVVQCDPGSGANILGFGLG